MIMRPPRPTRTYTLFPYTPLCRSAEKKAKAVPAAVDFARAAAAKGVTILYLSNRAVHLKDATLANLAAVGMPVASDEVFLGLGTVVPGCEQHGSEKKCRRRLRSEEHTSELQSLMRISYAVFCLTKKTHTITPLTSLATTI